MVFRLDNVSFSRSADSIMIASDASVVKHIPITRKQAEEVRRYKPLFHSPIKGKHPKNKNNAVQQPKPFQRTLGICWGSTTRWAAQVLQRTFFSLNLPWQKKAVRTLQYTTTKALKYVCCFFLPCCNVGRTGVDLSLIHI